MVLIERWYPLDNSRPPTHPFLLTWFLNDVFFLRTYSQIFKEDFSLQVFCSYQALYSRGKNGKYTIKKFLGMT